MDIFLTLVTNLIPLYMLIGLGFIAGKYFNVDKHTISNLVIYVCMPVMVFGFVLQLDLKPAYVLLPIIVFLIQVAIAGVMLKTGRIVYGDERANLLVLCSVSGNTGYFGLPLVLLLFKPEWAGVYIFMMLGGSIYESTLGYYIAARGKFTVRESLVKLAQFPAIYALAAALVVNLTHTHMPDLFTTYWTYFKGCYVVLGMMIIGVALSTAPRLVLAPKFISLSFFGKFVLLPLMAFLCITADNAWLHLFDAQVHKLFFILMLVPPAANSAAFAAQFDMRPEKAATTILLGTIFALFYIPAMLTFLGL